MCTNSCKRKVKHYDSFGAPIGVTFKGEPDYKTVCGGSITILLIFLLGGNLVYKLINFLLESTFTKRESSQYIPITQEREVWTMKTEYQQLTGRVLDELDIIPEGYSVD